jgi:thymidylate synthase (FAD)
MTTEIEPTPPETAAPPAIGEGDRIELLDHGFVRLDASMADDLSVANAARVSFARRKEELDDADRGLIRFLMRDRHGTPFEHNSFRFHIRCPIFVAREWMRHRIGCLTGDTVVTFGNTYGHATRPLARTLDQLWESWSEGERDGHAVDAGTASPVQELATMGVSQRGIADHVGVGRRAVRSIVEGKDGRRDARWRIRGMDLRVLDESTNEFTTGHIDNIIDKGVQPVYRVTLADGKALTLTENHRVLTDAGWRTMREALGLEGAGHAARMTRPARLVTNGTPAPQDPFGKEHLDRIGFALDLPAPNRTGWKLTGHPVAVVSVEYVGTRQTYDISVEGPWHNFVANGVVVHNSFNEFSLRYAKATDDFYVPDLDDVRSQVGKPGAYTFEPVEGELATHTRDQLRKVYDVAYETYTALVEAGVARELARSVLPVGAYTEFYWTVNARSLMNFVSLRAAETAQREIRRYALAVEAFLAREMPVTYAAFIGNERTAP